MLNVDPFGSCMGMVRVRARVRVRVRVSVRVAYCRSIYYLHGDG